MWINFKFLFISYDAHDKTDYTLGRLKYVCDVYFLKNELFLLTYWSENQKRLSKKNHDGTVNNISLTDLKNTRDKLTCFELKGGVH